MPSGSLVLVEVTMKVLIVLAAALLGAQAGSYLDLKEQWDAFKLQYGKQYASETEENFRMKIFADNVHKIEAHNQRFEQGLVTYTRGVNQFADLLHQEFVETYNSFNKSRWFQREDTKVVMFPDVQLPDSLGWRNQGVVTAVKDQGPCRSDYCFSTTGTVEGAHALKTGQLVSLSEQNLLDCAGGNCNDGIPPVSLGYIIFNHGIDTERFYPYEGQKGECRYSPKGIGATITKWLEVQTSEHQLQKALANIGPISVTIDGSHPSLQSYHGGVYDEPDCNPTYMSHSALLVGYGTTEDGTDYWIVKNSWGKSWGEEGYIRMIRFKDNQCGIATWAFYVVV